MLNKETREKIVTDCKPYTMTSFARLNFMIDCVEDVISNSIDGDIVECGVWKGGSLMCAIEVLKKHAKGSKRVIGYDTFEGMTKPNEEEQNYKGKKAIELYKSHPTWARCEQPHVWENLMRACQPDLDKKKKPINNGFPYNKLWLIKGDVSKTLKQYIPEKISVLRLDTDFYESTLHELVYLYPLLEVGGWLIIDDYHYWDGSKRAFDEYFMGLDIDIKRVDETAIAVKKGN